MRRRLNLRVLACLVFGLPLIAGGTHWLHNYQVRRNAGTLLEQADRAEEKGDRAGAVEYLQRYVALNRNDASAWSRLGLLLDRQTSSPRDRLKAFFVTEQALRLDPEQHETRRLLVRIAMELRQHSDAHEHLNTLLQAFPNDAELEDLQGQCAMAAARFAEADQWWQKAVQHAPGRIECWTRRAHLLRRRLNRPEDADRAMEAMIAANPQSAVAFLARGRYRAEFHPGEKAAADITHALQLAPDDAEVLLTSAEVEQSRGHTEIARAHLRHGIEKHPRNGRFLLSLARLELRDGQRSKAAECLRRSLPMLKDPLQQWTAADMLLDAGEASEAQTVIASLEKAAISRARIDFLQARLQMADKNWRRARDLLEGARQGLASSPLLLKQAHLLLAVCYRHLGNPDLRVAACRAALAVDSAWVPAQLELAAATAATGRFDEALAVYQKLASHLPSSRVAAGRLILRRTLRAPADRRNWAEIERFLKEAPEATQQSVEWRMLWIDVLVAQGRLADAEKYLQAARAEQPRQVQYRLALAALADRQEQPDRARKLIDEARRELGDLADLRLAQVARGLTGPKEKIHALLLQSSRDAGRFDKTEHARLLDGLVVAAIRADDIPLARQFADQRIQLQPNDVDGRLLAFRLAIQAADADASRHLLKELRQTEGEDGALWRYGEAALWFRFAKADDRTGVAAARKHLDEAAKRRPSWPPVALLDAELCEREGNLDQAIERYRQAVKLGERQPGVVRRVVQLLHTRRRYAEAEEVLRHLQEDMPLTGSLGRLAAEVSLLGRRAPEQTLELARKAVAADAADYREQLWFGQILAALDRHAEAEKVFRKAVELKADVPETWVNLVLLLARGKQTEAAETALRQAQEKLGAGAALPLAVCWEALNQRAKAADLYQTALKARPDDAEVLQAAAGFRLRSGQMNEAQPLLRKLLGAKVPAHVAAWARRSLALSLAMTGGSANVGKEALALIEQNLKEGGNRIEDQRVRALVLAMQPGRRRESIRLLEESFARLPASADEQFLLARLHEADRNWPKARAQMLELLAAESKNPLHLAYFVLALIHHDDLEAAEHWLEPLEKQEPNNWRTIEVKVRLLARQDRVADAVRLIQQHAAGKDAPVLLAAARLLDTLKQGDEAEKFYRQYAQVASQPEAPLVVAEFLAQRGQCDEALTLAGRAGPKSTPEQFAACCAALASGGKLTGQQRQRVEDWLAGLSAKQAKSVAVLLALAQFRDSQTRYADAQNLYRKALALDPGNIIAANNLAVLLTFHRQIPEAMELSRQTIDSAGPLAPLLDTRGTAYLSAGKLEQAVGDLEEAVAQQPTAARYYHLAQAYHAAKNRSAALLAFQKSKKLGLRAEALHPLERPGYEKVRAELDDASPKDRRD